MAQTRQSHRIGAPSAPGGPAHQFPSAGEYIIYSKPTFALHMGDRTELLECEAEMHVECSDALLGRHNARQVNVRVVRWEATGRSQVLGADIRFASVRDKGSEVIAGSQVADFPARMRLVIDYGLYVNGRLLEEHEGTAEGWVAAFPPRAGDLFGLTKSQNTHDLAALTGGQVSGNLRVSAVACACAS